MNDDDQADTEQGPAFFLDFPDAVPGNAVQVLLLDSSWRMGLVEEAVPDPVDPSLLGRIKLSTGASIESSLIGAIVRAN